jgi:hypothetical protein
LGTNTLSAFIDETEGYFAGSAALKDSIPGESLGVRAIPASELTTTIVDEIMATGTCQLPSIEESWPVHRELFGIFLDCIERVTGKTQDLCPIT